jgi:hypothetical protein
VGGSTKPITDNGACDLLQPYAPSQAGKERLQLQQQLAAVILKAEKFKAHSEEQQHVLAKKLKQALAKKHEHHNDLNSARSKLGVVDNLERQMDAMRAARDRQNEKMILTKVGGPEGWHGGEGPGFGRTRREWHGLRGDVGWVQFWRHAPLVHAPLSLLRA